MVLRGVSRLMAGKDNPKGRDDLPGEDPVQGRYFQGGKCAGEKNNPIVSDDSEYPWYREK